jgi:NNP family nitrate/nitrite transporter-like MFS transporter
MGVVTGIVGLVGALGGFVLPILFGLILDWLGINSSCFMFLYGVVWVSLILNYTTEVRRLPVMGGRSGDHTKTEVACGPGRLSGEEDPWRRA